MDSLYVNTFVFIKISNIMSCYIEIIQFLKHPEKIFSKSKFQIYYENKKK